MDESMMWIIFIVIVAVLLTAELAISSRGTGHIPVRKALYMTGFWVSVALIFGAFIYTELGSQAATEYIATYVVEESMSVDNLFVFLIIFAFFAIPDDDQHKVLFYGIIGAIFFRAIFIFAGAALLDNVHFVMYIFGAILMYTAFKTMLTKELGKTEDSFAVKLSKKIHSSPELDGRKFFTVRNGVRMATPMFICMIVIELTDIIFAFDSIPATLAITTDTFIVYTSNIFAVLGLRSLYFALRGTMTSLKFLKYGLGVILAFVGIKMLISDFYEVSVVVSLVFIVVTLLITIVASKWAMRIEQNGKGKTAER
jgi:tellurite resistance protein TerC